MNEHLLNELRDMRRILKSDYTREEFDAVLARTLELNKLYPGEVYSLAEFVAREHQDPAVDQ